MSCIAEKFSRFITLSESERGTLSQLEKEETQFSRREIVFSQDNFSENLYVVKDGWAMSYFEHSDGGRLVLNFHFPGDLINAMSLGMKRSSYTLMTLTKATLCPFPKKGFSELFGQSPRIIALIYAFGMLDNTVLVDRLRAVGRLSAENRLALVLLQISTRLNLLLQQEKLEFDAPLSQEILADSVGLTPVYVNRILANFREEGLVTLKNRRLVIHDRQALERMCEFKDRYYDLDMSWFQSAEAE